MDSSIIIEQSGIEFGTSGARGLVTSFTNEVCFAFTLAFINTQEEVKRIAIGIDNRPSSPAIAQACISAARYFGIKVDYFGVLPTPALAYSAQCASIPAIMITGSHIPFDRNGLKFYTKAGEITKKDEVAIISSSTLFDKIELKPLPIIDKSAFDIYVNRYLSTFSASLLKNKKIGIYQHSSAGRELYPHLFRALGAEVICLGYSDDFVPIDTEAVAESDRVQARCWTKEHNLDAIFSTDGDGDRPLLADENGDYFTGDILCMLAAKSLRIESLAVPISCITSIEGSNYFKQVKRTKIGSPYVIEAFCSLKKVCGSVAGFEANGGFLLASDITLDKKILSSLPTRDAVLPFLAVMKLAGKGTLSSLCNILPKRFTYSDRIKGIPRLLSEPIMALGVSEPKRLLKTLNLSEMNIKTINTIDGLRVTFTNSEIMHIRPSGNAPELRCYTESDSAYNAKCLADKVLQSIKTHFKL